MKRAITPQEVEVWYIIPAIRRALARSLKELGMKQKEIARLLGVTEAAVSQYLSKKRGDQIVMKRPFLKLIRESSERMKNKKSSLMEELIILTRQARKMGQVCEVHRRQGCVDKNCNICFKKGLF